MSPDAGKLSAPDEQNVLGLGGLLSLAPVIFSAAAAREAGRLQILEQHSLQEWKPSLLTLPEMSEMLRRTLLDRDEYQREMARLGYSPDRIEKMLALSEPLLDVNTLSEASRRGIVPDDQYRRLVAQLGFNPAQVDLIAQLRPYVPSAQDVVTFAVREVYTPAVAERFGQYDNFPVDALPDFAKAGVDEATAKKYWAAHWQLPSVQLGFEMFQRNAETGVTEDDLRKLLRAADVMPFWQEKIIAVSYSPYTRVDIRRMHKLGVLNREQVVRAYRDIGYNPERAEQLTQFTEKLNGADTDAEAKKLHTALRTKARNLYEDSVLDADGLRDVYLALGYDESDAEAFVQEAEFVRVADVRKEQRAAIKVMYVRGAITEAETRARLEALGYDGATTARIVEPWLLDREARERTAAEHHERDLTRADIVGAYTDTILSRDDAERMLGLLGYDNDETELIVQRADAASAKAQRTAIEHAVHAQYMARRIGKAAAISLLGTGKVSQARTTYLIAEWEMELDARVPLLTVPQITAAYKAGLINSEDAATRFDAHGYTVDDRNILLGLAKGKDDGGQ